MDVDTMTLLDVQIVNSYEPQLSSTRSTVIRYEIARLITVGYHFVPTQLDLCPQFPLAPAASNPRARIVRKVRQVASYAWRTVYLALRLRVCRRPPALVCVHTLRAVCVSANALAEPR